MYYDNVNHPKHYTSDPSGVECIEITRHRNFNVGNAMKYLWRAGLKDSNKTVEDLQKAIFYIRDEIKRIGGETELQKPSAAPAVKPDDIYLIYADHNEIYTGANDTEGVKYIGVAFQGRSFAIALRDAGEEIALLPEDKNTGYRLDYKRRECDAIYDYDSGKNTALLCDDNPYLRGILQEGEAIPALGILNIMAHLKGIINEALKYVGGDELKDTWYWSSTESSQSGAWGVNFSSGGTINGNEYNRGAVRAVAAF